MINYWSWFESFIRVTYMDVWMWLHGYRVWQFTNWVADMVVIMLFPLAVVCAIKYLKGRK